MKRATVFSAALTIEGLAQQIQALDLSSPFAEGMAETMLDEIIACAHVAIRSSSEPSRRLGNVDPTMAKVIGHHFGIS